MTNSKFGPEYFARLRTQELPFWAKFKAIPREQYQTVQAAAVAALRKIWHRSWLQQVEWGGVLYRRGGQYGFGIAQTSELGMLVAIYPQEQTKATLAGLYHTHVNVPFGDANNLSPHDREQARQIGGPVFLATPKMVVIECSPTSAGFIERNIGKIEEAPLAEVYKETRPPDPPLRALLQEHRRWRLSQLP